MFELWRLDYLRGLSALDICNFVCDERCTNIPRIGFSYRSPINARIERPLNCSVVPYKSIRKLNKLLYRGVTHQCK